MKNSWNEFYKKASLLKHNTDALKAGEEIISYQTFPTLEAGRRLLSVAGNEQRIKRQLDFFNPAIAARSRLGQGIHDRGEAILFANGSFLDSDHLGVGNHMPAKLKAISVLKKTVTANETWDISVRGSQWGMDDTEELYVTVNVGELILEPGAKIIVTGNVFSLLCQRLVCIEESAAGDFHIGILPTPFSVDPKGGPHNGYHGRYGDEGLTGRDGRDVQVSSSIIGYTLTDPVKETEMDATDGEHASDGSNAYDGRNGGMCKIAEITIRDLQGYCTVFSQAGTGGDGGNGGDGGDGGNGGNGSAGHKLITGILRSGDGGKGGNAGLAGKGGNAGHGGLSSNIYMDIPVLQEDQVHCMSLPASGGKGGTGGRAGKPGSGGKGGDGFTKGSSGTNGQNGTNGKNGFDGRTRPGPWIFVNEKRKDTSAVDTIVLQDAG